MARPRLHDAIELVSARIAPQDLEALDFVAKHDNKTPSAIMRQALRTYLNQRVVALSR